MLGPLFAMMGEKIGFSRKTKKQSPNNPEHISDSHAHSACSTSPPSGNLVDGLPLVAHREPMKLASLFSKRREWVRRTLILMEMMIFNLSLKFLNSSSRFLEHHFILTRQ